MTRVTIVQPSLAKYRVPVYRALAKRSGINLRVVYAQSNGIPNVLPEGFAAEFQPLYVARLGLGHMLWHGAQINHAAREHCDVLILSWDLHYASLVPALLRARANRVATILWGHGYSKRESPWRARLRQLPARLADVLLFYSDAPARTYVEKYGFKQSRVAVARNSLDQSIMEAARIAWLSDPSGLTAFRETNGLAGRPTILFCSRLDRANRVDLLIMATAIIKRTISDVRVVVIGAGEAESELRHLAQKLELVDNVVFLGAIYDEMGLAPWFLSADVFCYPENIGLSLLHAFGYGLPVVTSDKLDTQNPEIEALRTFNNGVLYRHGDHVSLSNALSELLTNRPFRERLSRAAQHTVREDFSLERMVDGFERAIKLSVNRQDR